jgi:hypothetical protein
VQAVIVRKRNEGVENICQTGSAPFDDFDVSISFRRNVFADLVFIRDCHLDHAMDREAVISN